MLDPRYCFEKLPQYHKPAQELTYTEMLFFRQICGELYQYSEDILKKKELAMADSVPFLQDVVDKQTGGFGQCGENLFWKIEGSVLYISGEGAMWDFGTSTQEDRFPIDPWRKKSNCFREVVICEGITSIGICAFENMELNEIIIPASLKVIRECAFTCAAIRNLILPNTLNTLEPNIIVGHPCRVDSLSVCVNIPDIQSEAFRSVSFAPKEIKLTGDLPEDLSALVDSNLFHSLGHWIYYPRKWNSEDGSFFWKLSNAIKAYADHNKSTNFSEDYYKKLKDTLRPY